MAIPAAFPSSRRYSEEEFFAARDSAPAGERWELLDGEAIVTPAPHWVHQIAVSELLLRLDPYVRAEQLGRVLVAPVDYRMAPGKILQPDLLVVPDGVLRTLQDVVRDLRLAVEVLSPGSARHDRFGKRVAYQRHGVPEYWLVDLPSRSIERWQPGDERPAVLDRELVWHPPGAGSPFALDIARYFADVVPDDATDGA